MRSRLDLVLEQMALWAVADYRSPKCRDSDVVAMLDGRELTVGCLRWAFERYYKTPFKKGSAG